MRSGCESSEFKMISLKRAPRVKGLADVGMKTGIASQDIETVIPSEIPSEISVANASGGEI